MMTISLTGPLVSTEWLATHLQADDLVVLVASFKLPGVTDAADVMAVVKRALNPDAIMNPGKIFVS